MNKTGLLEKTKDEDGMYELKLNDYLLFRAADNETIKSLGQAIAKMSEADDYATMVIG